MTSMEILEGEKMIPLRSFTFNETLGCLYQDAEEQSGKPVTRTAMAAVLFAHLGGDSDTLPDLDALLDFAASCAIAAVDGRTGGDGP